MFGKKQPHLEIIIGPESTIKGEVTSKGAVRVDGRFEGNVTAECVIIGETGTITGDIFSKSLIVGGKIVGNVRASEGVEIQPRGEVCGDIYASRIVMAEGGRFDGHSYMQRTRDSEYAGNGLPQEGETLLSHN